LTQKNKQEKQVLYQNLTAYSANCKHGWQNNMHGLLAAYVCSVKQALLVIEKFVGDLYSS